jgi:hypothetical protein
MNRPTPPRRLLSALAAVLLASTGVAFTAQSASADGGQKVVRVQDRCDQPTWDQDPFHELNGLCNPDGGDVTPARFRADLPRGGNGHWRFNNRDETVNRGDVLVIRSEGGELHTFSDMTDSGYTASCLGVPGFPVAMPEHTNLNLAVPGSPAPSLARCLAAFGISSGGLGDLAPPGVSLPRTLAPGTHKVQCLIHPWMRGTVTVT